MEAPAAPSLSTLLREGTEQAHRQAERSAFIEALFGGMIDRPAYGRFLRALRALYGALESGLSTHAQDSRVGPLVRPEVFRCAALDEDLAFFEVEEGPPLAATRRFVDRLEWLAQHDPVLLVAHAYVRTLGDLSGGQLLKQAVQRSFHLSGDAGCSFYVFPQIAALGSYKNGYRAALDALPLDARTRERVVAESAHAFELHAALFVALGAN